MPGDEINASVDIYEAARQEMETTLIDELKGLSFREIDRMHDVIADLYILHKSKSNPQLNPRDINFEEERGKYSKRTDLGKTVLNMDTLQIIQNGIEDGNFEHEMSRLSTIEEMYNNPVDYSAYFDNNYKGSNPQADRETFLRYAKLNDAVKYINPDKAVPLENLMDKCFDKELEEYHNLSIENKVKIDKYVNVAGECHYLSEKIPDSMQRSYFCMFDPKASASGDIMHTKVDAYFGDNMSPEAIEYRKRFMTDMVNKMLSIPDEKLALKGGTKEADAFYAEHRQEMYLLFECENLMGGAKMSDGNGIRQYIDIPEEIVDVIRHKKQVLNMSGEEGNINAAANDKYRENALLDNLGISDLGNLMRFTGKGKFGAPMDTMELISSRMMAVSSQAEMKLVPPDKKFDGFKLEYSQVKSREVPETIDTVLEGLTDEVDKSYIRSSEQFRKMKATLTAMPEAISRCRTDAERNTAYGILKEKAEAYMKYKFPEGSKMEDFNDYEKSRIQYTQRIIKHCNDMMKGYGAEKQVNTIRGNETVIRLNEIYKNDEKLASMIKTPKKLNESITELTKLAQMNSDNAKVKYACSTLAEKMVENAKTMAGSPLFEEWKNYKPTDVEKTVEEEMKFMNNIKDDAVKEMTKDMGEKDSMGLANENKQPEKASQAVMM